MLYVVFLYASGWAFLVGAAMIVGGIALPPRRTRWAKFLVGVGALIFVAPSSTPLPWIGYGFLALVTCLWWRIPFGLNGLRSAVAVSWLEQLTSFHFHRRVPCFPRREAWHPPSWNGNEFE